MFGKVERIPELDNIKTTEELHNYALSISTEKYPVWNLTRIGEGNINGEPIIYLKKNLGDNGSYKKFNEYFDTGIINNNILKKNGRLLQKLNINNLLNNKNLRQNKKENKRDNGDSSLYMFVIDPIEKDIFFREYGENLELDDDELTNQTPFDNKTIDYTNIPIILFLIKM